MPEKTSKKSAGEQLLRGTGKLLGAMAVGAILGVVVLTEASVNFFRDGEKFQMFKRGPSYLPANEGAKRLELYNLAQEGTSKDEDRVAPFNRIVAAVGEQAVKLRSWLDEDLPLERCGRAQEYREQVERSRLARKARRLAPAKQGQRLLRFQNAAQRQYLLDYDLDGIPDATQDVIVATRIDPGYLQ